MEKLRIDSKMVIMIKRLIEAEFEEEEIIDIMEKGIKSMRFQKYNKSLVGDIAKESGITVQEFVEYYKENKEAMLFALEQNIKEVQETQTPQEKSLSKSAKLQSKVEQLIEKIENEQNPIKRHILSFQIKMLISKIQREIDLNNIRAEYQFKRDDLSKLKEEREEQGIDKIAELNERIRFFRGIIAGNEEYDADSPNFIYPKDYVQELGGIEEFSNKLKQSKKMETQQVVKRIEHVAEVKKNIQDLEEQLYQAQKYLQDNKKDYRIGEKNINREEKSLILKQKMNVFSRIGEFFSNMMEEIKLYKEERKQDKELEAKLKEEQNAIDVDFKKQIEELKGEQRKAKEQLQEQQSKEKEERQNQKKGDKAAQFRKQMFEMTQLGGETVVEETSSQNHRLSEEIQPIQEDEGR